MLDEEYFQHVYMIMGRARKLEWVLIRNFPYAPDGEPDWSVFESGPPAYLCEFLEVLEQRAKETWPRLLRCQRELGMPAWEDIKPCAPDPEASRRYLYGTPCLHRTFGTRARRVACESKASRRSTRRKGSTGSKGNKGEVKGK